MDYTWDIKSNICADGGTAYCNLQCNPQRDVEVEVVYYNDGLVQIVVYWVTEDGEQETEEWEVKTGSI